MELTKRFPTCTRYKSEGGVCCSSCNNRYELLVHGLDARQASAGVDAAAIACMHASEGVDIIGSEAMMTQGGL